MCTKINKTEKSFSLIGCAKGDKPYNQTALQPALQQQNIKNGSSNINKANNNEKADEKLKRAKTKKQKRKLHSDEAAQPKKSCN